MVSNAHNFAEKKTQRVCIVTKEQGTFVLTAHMTVFLTCETPTMEMTGWHIFGAGCMVYLKLCG